jgi:hypothetical protein
VIFGSEKSRFSTGTSESRHGPANNDEKKGERSRIIRCKKYDLPNAWIEISEQTPFKKPRWYKWSSIGLCKVIAFSTPSARKEPLVRHCLGLYEDAREARREFEKEVCIWYVIVSSSAEVSRSLTAISVGKPVLSRNRGLAEVVDDVIFATGEGVAGRREVEGIGEDDNEFGVPIDFIRREGGVGTSGVE